MLRYFAKYRKRAEPESYERLTAAASRLRESTGRLRSIDPASADARTNAMGVEGHAASVYW